MRHTKCHKKDCDKPVRFELECGNCGDELPVCSLEHHREVEATCIYARERGYSNVTFPAKEEKKNVLWLKETCSACPSQWEGELSDGQFIYVRYRWGCLSVCCGPTLDDAIWGQPLVDWEGGDGLDGTMSVEELKEHCAEVLSFEGTVFT